MLAKDNIQAEMQHNTDNSNSENKVNVGKASGNTTNTAAFFVKVPESLEKANVEESNSINKYQKDNTTTTINTPSNSSEPLLLCKAEHEMSTLKNSSEGASQGISAFSTHSSISENGHADVRINDMINSETSFTHEERTNESNRSSPIAQSTTNNINKSDYISSSHVPLHPLELEKNEETNDKTTTSVKNNDDGTNVNLRVTNVTRTHSGLATLLRANNNNNNKLEQHYEKQKQSDEGEKSKEIPNAAQMSKHVEMQNTTLLSSKANTTFTINNVNTEGNTYSSTTKPYTASTNNVNNVNNVSSNYTQRIPQSLYTVTANASLDEDCYPMLQIHSHHHNNNNNNNSNNNNTTNNLSSSSCSSSNNSNSHSFHHDYSHQQKQQQLPQKEKEKEKEMNEYHSSSANVNYENNTPYSLHNQPTEANTNIMNNNNNVEDDASYPYCIIENTNENSHINNNTMNNNNFMEEGNLSNNNPNPENNNNGPAMSCVPTVRAEELLDLLDQHQRSQINNHNNISNDNSNSSNNGVCCPPGWFFSVYDADISQHYSIPSEQVEITRGAIKYLMLYEKFGQQTRFRFQLCKRFLHQRCGSGAECHYIHSQMVPTSTWVHINENCVTALNTHTLSEEELRGGKNKLKYITMPCGILFKIYPPNQSNAPPQLIPSDKILYTMGATNVYRVLVRHNHEQQHNNNSNNLNNNINNNLASEVAKLKPRHCAHFQFKRMCNLGTSCNFIHSLVPFIQGVVNQPPIPPELMWQVEQQQPNKMSHRTNNNNMNMNMNMNQNNYPNGYPSGNNNNNALTIRVGAPSVNNVNNNNYPNNRMEMNSMPSMLPSSTPSQQYNIPVPTQMYNNNNNQMMNEANYYQYAQQQQQQQQQQQFTPNQYVVNNLNNNNDVNNAQMYQRNEYNRINNNNNNNNVMSVNGPVQTSVSNYPLQQQQQQQVQQIQRQEVQEGQQQPFHYQVENNNNNNSMATMMMMQMKMKSMPMSGNYNTVNNGYNEQQQGQVQQNGNVYLNAPNYYNYNYNENNNFQEDVNETRRSLQQQQPQHNVSLYSYSSLSPAQNIIHESDNNNMNTNQINSQAQRMPHLIQHTQMVQENINNSNSQIINNNNNENNNNGNYENRQSTPAQRYTAYSSIVNEVRPEIQNYTSTTNNNNMNDVSLLNEMNMSRQNRSTTATSTTNTTSPSQPSYSLHSEPEIYKMNRNNNNNNNIYPAYQTDNIINNVNMNEGNANTFSRQSAQSMSSDYRRNENNHYSQANSTSYITNNNNNNNGEMFISSYANSERAVSTIQQPQSMANAHLYHDANHMIMNERQINANESNMEKLAYMQNNDYSQQQQNHISNPMENQRPQSYSATRHANYTMTNANNYNTVQYA